MANRLPYLHVTITDPGKLAIVAATAFGAVPVLIDSGANVSVAACSSHSQKPRLLIKLESHGGEMLQLCSDEAEIVFPPPSDRLDSAFVRLARPLPACSRR